MKYFRAQRPRKPTFHGAQQTISITKDVDEFLFVNFEALNLIYIYIFVIIIESHRVWKRDGALFKHMKSADDAMAEQCDDFR